MLFCCFLLAFLQEEGPDSALLTFISCFWVSCSGDGQTDERVQNCGGVRRVE